MYRHSGNVEYEMLRHASNNWGLETVTKRLKISGNNTRKAFSRFSTEEKLYY
jgi:hypothetical protein